MAKRVTYTEEIPLSETKWRGATFFSSVGDDETTADKRIDKLVRKYLKNTGKAFKREVKDV